MENKIYSINGPVVTIKGKTDLAMMEMVYVGKSRLVGEVIRMTIKRPPPGLRGDRQPESRRACRKHRRPLSVTLGPGILRNIYDGIQRPLPRHREPYGQLYRARCTRAFSGYRRQVGCDRQR